MNLTFFYFLIESSLYLLLFLVIYHFAIKNLTYFSWMRAYLLTSLSLSLILPMIKLPEHWSDLIFSPNFYDKPFSINILKPLIGLAPKSIESGIQTSSHFNIWATLIFVFSTIYFIGVFFQSYRLIKNLHHIRRITLKNPRKKEGKYWIINIDNKVAAFSFFNFIFLNGNYNGINSEELRQIKNHELIHVNQWHTLDILFVEIITILFWFSPLVRYAKNNLQDIHEYIADEKTAGNGEMKRHYAQLLINLASEIKPFRLSTGFSGKQISNRVRMISKKRSPSRFKLIFLSLVPASTLLLLSFSYLGNITAISALNNHKLEINSSIKSSQKIGNINWVNNIVFNSDELNSILGIKKGDFYNKKNFENRIWKDMDGISTNYLDKGYVFSNFEIAENTTKEGKVDLTIILEQ